MMNTITSAETDGVSLLADPLLLEGGTLSFVISISDRDAHAATVKGNLAETISARLL